MAGLEQKIGELLLKKRLTLGTVESATGGLIAHRITNISGSSAYYKGSIIAYKNEIKINIIGVSQHSIDQYGAVSSQVAEEMALGGKKLLGVDLCLADTGIAGPTGATEEKPVGLFYLGFANPNETLSRKHEFTGSREQNKQNAAEAALNWLRDYLWSWK